MDTVEITRLSKYSWFEIKYHGRIIHFDPGYAGYFENQKIAEKEFEEKADLVLISHFHKDHLQPEALKRITGPETKIIASLNCADRLEKGAVLVKPGDVIETGAGVRVHAVDAYNTPEGHSMKKFHHRGECVGYVLDLQGMRIYFAGDTDFIPEMRKIADVDIAFLPVGGTFTMDMGEAACAVAAIRPRFAVPMHQLHAELDDFKKESGIRPETEIITLKTGERKQLCRKE